MGLLVPVVAASGAGAQTASQSAPTSQDIRLRDQLIADQENLLNTYRCMFGVDTHAVPGGCGEPGTVAAGAAPQNPAQSDLEVRDGLIQSQEALLNAYRCQFNIDTQLVPSGCADQTGPQPTGRPDQTGPQPEPEATTFTAITVGDFHSCGIRDDSTAVCWGNDNDGMADAPDGAFTAIAAGVLHSCGIRADSTAVCWGNDDDGQADVPAGAFTAIAAGFGHS